MGLVMGQGRNFPFLTCSALQADTGPTAVLFGGRHPPHVQQGTPSVSPKDEILSLIVSFPWHHSVVLLSGRTEPAGAPRPSWPEFPAGLRLDVHVPNWSYSRLLRFLL